MLGWTIYSHEEKLKVESNPLTSIAQANDHWDYLERAGSHLLSL